MSNNTKPSADVEHEVLTLYFNGIVSLKAISNIVRFSEPTISRIVGNNLTNYYDYKKEYRLFESKMNYE